MRAALVGCLDYMNDLPFFRAYKAQTWESLRIGESEIFRDVACGVGFDVIEMGKAFSRARFTGVDKSASLLDIARSRAGDLPNVDFAPGDAGHLPFPDNAFDGARIDRSLQHIPDPASAVREMTRVVRPGGRIVAAEPDWGTFFLHIGDAGIGERMTAQWRESFANPFIGRELGDIFAACGVADVACRAHALALTRLESADVVFDLRRLAENCVTAGVLSADWRAGAERASEKGAFLACLTIIERWGTVPA